MSFSFPSHSSFPLDLKQSITLFCLSQQTRSEQRTKLCYFIHSFIRDLGESNKQGRTQQGFQLNLRFEVTHKTELTRVRGCKQARRRKGSRSGYKGFQLRGRGEFRRIKEGLFGGKVSFEEFTIGKHRRWIRSWHLGYLRGGWHRNRQIACWRSAKHED